MSKLQRNQIVACWDKEGEDKFIRIFVGTRKVRNRGEFFECRLPGDAKGILAVELWENCVPLEEVESGAFLSCDRDLVDSLQKDRERQHQAIGWLCKELQAIGDRNGEQECPPSPYHDCRRGSCADCWEQASLEAVKEGADGTSEESSALGR